MTSSLAPASSSAVTVAGITFQNPVLLAAGTAGFGREVDGVLDLDRLGGLVTKAVSLQPRKGNPSPRVAEFRGGMLNSVGLANPGVDLVRDQALPWLAGRLVRARVLVNVVGFREEEYAAVIRRLDGLEVVAGYELNLSCPNTAAGGLEFGADRASVVNIISRCRQVTPRPLFAKLSPALADIGGMAAAARDAGADGVSVINTLAGFGYREASETMLGQGYGGVSGPALLPIGVQAVRRVLQRTEGLPVIGVGGITDTDGARQYLQAGASLVAIGTGALGDPRLPGRIVEGLERGGWRS